MAWATTNPSKLILSTIGPDRAEAVLRSLRLPDDLQNGNDVSRAHLAMALNVLLFEDLLQQVPTARRYVEDVVTSGGTVRFDHGALRTVDGATGALPSGSAAFSRLLEPLGYRVAGLYPLPRLGMTGRAFVHSDRPDNIPQFFVSELHVARLPDEAQFAAARVFAGSSDPLGETEKQLLAMLAADGRCSWSVAAAGLPGLARAFQRQHPVPSLADYDLLLRHSAEAAWIATEGNAFNHAADRVPDVAALANELRTSGFPLKAGIEVSASGRVRQTAFRADRLVRPFRLPDGSLVRREVPGSFFELISRDVDPATGRVDLGFDSGNATGIFTVTSAR